MSGVAGMVDLHHHILPEVDDGARNLDEAVQLARRAVEQGISTVVATPHVFDGVHDVEREVALAAADRLRDALALARVPLEIRVAAELRVDERLEQRLRDEPGLSLDGHGRYALIELPHESVPPFLTPLLFRMRAHGTVPVIAHPERNLGVRGNPEITQQWVEFGAMLQITAAALDGALGPVIGRTARYLLAHGRVHLVATDAHRIDRRPPHVAAAFEIAARVVGRDGAHALFVGNPAIVARSGSPDSIVAPERVRRGGLVGWFDRARST